MEHSQEHGEYQGQPKKSGKVHNVLPLWGNESTMNLNPLILANIQSSSYFKVHLFKLKTYHEVVDEIYYQVKHLEPWERGSRKTAGQTGMCGGVRGVGAGGIVSTAYCLLYKLYTLRLTRKQLNGLLTHSDSPYIRSLGFMYIRYTQPPADLYDWYEEYLLDDEPVDAKAGGGQPATTIGQMLHQFLVKLDWFSTLFPRIPVPIQKQIEQRLSAFSQHNNVNLQARFAHAEREQTAASHAAAVAASAANAALQHGGGSGGGGGRGRYQQQQQQQQHNQQHRSYESRDGRDRGDTSNNNSSSSSSQRRYRSRSRERPDNSRYDDRAGGGGYSDGGRDYRHGDRDRAYGSSSSTSSAAYAQRRSDRDDRNGGGGGGGSSSSSRYYERSYR